VSSLPANDRSNFQRGNMMETARAEAGAPALKLTKTGALPVNVRKFLKWIVDPDLVKPYLIPANAFLDRGPVKKPSNICLRGDTFRQRLHAPSLRVFRPDRVNVNRREVSTVPGKNCLLGNDLSSVLPSERPLHPKRRVMIFSGVHRLAPSEFSLHAESWSESAYLTDAGSCLRKTIFAGGDACDCHH